MDKQKDLYEKFPILYRKGVELGYTCLDGWDDLILDLSGKIEQLLLEMKKLCFPDEIIPFADQIKEKFGYLRFYLDTEKKDPLQQYQVQAQYAVLFVKIHNCIQEAENKSKNICEFCGQTGNIKNINGLLKCVCNEDFVKMIEKRQGLPNSSNIAVNHLKEIVELSMQKTIPLVRKEDELVQYYLVNSTLNMRKGKMSAQCAHGSLLHHIMFSTSELYGEWFINDMRKIVLKASPEEMIKALREFPEKTTSVFDKGYSDVPAGSWTVVVLPILKRSDVPKWILDLNLM